jgi:sulfate/thiosulfate transport system substrate-binding protein
MKQAIVSATAATVLASAFAVPSLTFAKPAASGGTLAVVGYSTPGPVYGTQSMPGTLEYAFAHTKAGKGVSFTNSFSASDTQSQAVANGLPADVVNFSYAPNIQSLVADHLVPKTWDHNQYHGNITNSVVAFGVRPHNPKHIKTWNDLLKKGLSVLTPNPKASGGAKWNLLAAYGAEVETGHSKAQGINYLKKLFKNVTVMDTSGSHELNTFLGGKGDVMIGYQDDMLSAATKSPGKIQIVTPPQSLLIENPAGYTLPPASHNEKLAKAFVAFLYSKKAQTIWAQNNYWPVLAGVAKKYKFPRPKQKLFNIRQLGGWPKLDPEFFGTNGIVTKILNGG